MAESKFWGYMNKGFAISLAVIVSVSCVTTVRAQDKRDDFFSGRSTASGFFNSSTGWSSEPKDESGKSEALEDKVENSNNEGNAGNTNEAASTSSQISKPQSTPAPQEQSFRDFANDVKTQQNPTNKAEKLESQSGQKTADDYTNRIQSLVDQLKTSPAALSTRSQSSSVVSKPQEQLPSKDARIADTTVGKQDVLRKELEMLETKEADQTGTAEGRVDSSNVTRDGILTDVPRDDKPRLSLLANALPKEVSQGHLNEFKRVTTAMKVTPGVVVLAGFGMAMSDAVNIVNTEIAPDSKRQGYSTSAALPWFATTLLDLGIEASGTYDLAVAIKDLGVNVSPLWVVSYKGREFIYAGINNPSRLFTAQGEFKDYNLVDYASIPSNGVAILRQKQGGPMFERVRFNPNQFANTEEAKDNFGEFDVDLTKYEYIAPLFLSVGENR